MFRAAIICALIAGLQCAQITNLPGAPSVSFNQYSGFVQASSTRYLHYWFVESQRAPSTDPLILWLNGGPGCSSVGGFLTELGPFQVNPDGATLRLNPYGWNMQANVFALEAPAGVGYSYSTNNDVSSNDNRTATENYAALKNFFAAFPQYRTNDFYVMGESYGGVYVPTLVQTILDNQAGFNIKIKGFSIGNGCVSANLGVDSIVQFVYNHGLVDEQKWQQAKTQCCNNQIDGCAFHTFTGNGFCPNFANDAQNLAWNSGINPYGLYQDCHTAIRAEDAIQTRYHVDLQQRFGKSINEIQAENGNVLAAIPCLNETAVTNYMNLATVRAAMSIPSVVGKWSFCSTPVNFAYTRSLSEMQSRVQYAIKSGLRGVIYNGDTDMACNFLMSQRFSATLGLTEKVSKKLFHVDGQVAGTYTAYNGLEFYTVRGAGHMVPTDKPSVSYHILQSFLNQRAP
uniref:Carboxypeptidase n=1 Tax=Plectus sambesii TaxID=2011161 RepID=A0A914W4Q2_9BILA